MLIKNLIKILQFNAFFARSLSYLKKEEEKTIYFYFCYYYIFLFIFAVPLHKKIQCLDKVSQIHKINHSKIVSLFNCIKIIKQTILIRYLICFLNGQNINDMLEGAAQFSR